MTFAATPRRFSSLPQRAEHGGADLVIFSELSVCGYPPADLLEKPSFVARAGQVVQEIAAKTAASPTAIICGYVTPAHHGAGKHVMNSAALLRHGHVEFVQSKMLLPFYDVFDEQRYFAPAHKQRLFSLGGEHVALTICEDAWNDKSFWENRLYSIDPIEELMRGGGSLILNISASPYWRDKRETRREMLAAIARRHGKPVLMVNQVGGNDSLVFDGSSLALGRDGQVIAQAASFEEDLIFIDTESLTGDMHPETEDEDEAIFQALVLGTRDYVRKCGFSRAIVGLSGGIDSALVAAIAVEALGKENVLGIGMPSPYSSQGSIDDSRRLAENLGIRFEVVPISRSSLNTTRPSRLSSPASSPTSPRRTSSRASAATCSWRSPTSSTRSCSPPATRARCPPATALSTAIWSEPSPSSATSSRPRSTPSAVISTVSAKSFPRPSSTSRPPPSCAPIRRTPTRSRPTNVLDPILEAYVERYETPEHIAAALNVDIELVRSRRQTRGAQRIQAPAGRPRLQSHHQGLRHGTPLSHRRQGSGISKPKARKGIDATSFWNP